MHMSMLEVPGSSMLLSPLLEVEITRESTAICMASGVVRQLAVAAEPAACMRMLLEDNMRRGVAAAYPRKSLAGGACAW